MRYRNDRTLATREDVSRLVQTAIEQLIDREPELLDLDVGERALTHRLACYIAALAPAGLSVDVEYNRHQTEPKRLSLPRRDALDDELRATTVFPDIIIHRRGTDASNVLVLELKKRRDAEELRYDGLKLRAFKEELHYKHAAHLILGRDGRGQLISELEWVGS